MAQSTYAPPVERQPSRRWLSPSVALAGFFFVLVSLAWPAPALAMPTISVDPAAGASPGATVTVIGDGFVPGESVTVSYVGSTFGPVFADDAGRFTLEFTMPTAPPDSHPLETSGDQGSAVSVEYELITDPVVATPTTEAPTTSSAPTSVTPPAAPAETPATTVANTPADVTGGQPDGNIEPGPDEESDAENDPLGENEADPVVDPTSSDPSTPWGWYVVILVIFITILVLFIVVGNRRGQLRDTSWVKKLGKIDHGLPPVAPAPQKPDWSLHIHDGKQWVPVRAPKNAAYEYRVRLVSNVSIAATQKHKVWVTSLAASRPERSSPVSTHDLATTEGLKRFRGYANRIVDNATHKIDGANLEAAATIYIRQCRGGPMMAHLNPDQKGVEIAPLVRVDDVTRIELMARGAGGAALKNQWTAQGASWKKETAKYAFAEGHLTGANLLELSRDVVRGLLDVSTKRAVMVASTNVESTVELDLAYAVAAVAKGATSTPPSKSEKAKLKEALTAAVKTALGPLTSKIPGYDFFTTVATGDMSADSGSGGGVTNSTGRNQSAKTAATFTTEIVNNATVSAAIHHFRSDNDDNVDVEGSTQVYHHIKIDSEYGGPPLNWANGKPAFSIEVGRPAAKKAAPFTPPPPGDAAVIKIGGKVVREIYRAEGRPWRDPSRALDTYSSTTHWTPTWRRP